MTESFNLVEGGTTKSTGLTRNGAIAIAVACTVVVSVALGVGLGLGLNNDNGGESPAAEVTECYKSLQYNDNSNYDPNIPWDRTCTTPGVPVCPIGIVPPLLLISLDGFRDEYLSRNVTPTLARLSECGVTVPHIRSSYPSKTFPNHYSLVTGLHTEAHGIIANKMYDINLSEEFSLGSENSFKAHWWHGEPIWNTVVKAGRKAVTMYWPGSEVAIQDMRPDSCYVYNESVPFEDRVNEIMGYFSTTPEEYPAIVTFYMHQPDAAGHNGGPYGQWVEGNLTHVDYIIQLLMSGLQQKGLHQCVNVMVVSDHGMENIDCDRTIDLTPYYGDMLDDLHMYDGEQVRITSQFVERNDEIVQTPGGASVDEILDRVKCTHYNSTKDWYVRFDRKEDLPKRLHYSNSIRIEEVIGEVEAQWLVFRDAASEPWWECTGGAHGFDPVYQSMHAIFLGSGPGFKSRYVADQSFDNVELYNLMAALLELSAPAPTNGTYGALHDLLSTTIPLPDPTLPAGTYEECLYPDDNIEEELRRNTTDTCNWVDVKNFTSLPISSIDGQLNLDMMAQNESVGDHLALGVPQVDFMEADVCQLIQKDYIMGYSHQHHMPLWSAARLSKNPDCITPSPDCYRTDNIVYELVRPDVRLTADQQIECNQYSNKSMDIQGHYLFPPGLISTSTNPEQYFDAYISTNIVPMYEEFRTGVWQEVWYVVEEYAEKYDDLHIVAGPIFDYNSDGRRDTMESITMFVGDGIVPVPTHYYMIVSRCTNPGSIPLDCVPETDVLAVILPHRPVTTNCWDRRYFDYIEKNVARVHDIELLTDLRFYTSVLEQKRLHMSVFLSETLWDRMSWMDLTGTGDEQCPTLGAATSCPAGYDSAHPPVLLVSMDGFRPDYVDRGLSPTIEKLRDCGTSADYMRSIYPTLTFPNHYTITSGLYPESHGIVDNNMYDMDLEEAFWLGSPSSFNSQWWTGKPLWNTVEENNKTAMTLFWPGSDVEIGGVRPSKYFLYNGDMPYDLRVSTVLDWLKYGSDGNMPDFITLYFSNTDTAGHVGGPDSLLVSEALVVVDDAIKNLMDGIYRMGLHQCINVILVSDHGMTDISCDWNVLLNDYLDMTSLINKTYLYYGSAARMSNKYYRDSNYNYHHVDPVDQVSKESIINSLTCDSSNMNVFDKVDLPKRHHYANNDRIDDITFITADSWLVEDFSPWCAILGQHGWDPYFQTMKAYFSAYGPGFQEKLQVDYFENIELYNIMSYLIGVPPAVNNGTEGSLHHILKNPPVLNTPSSTSYTDCTYPDNDVDYGRRADLNTSLCQCTPSGIITITEADERLNLTSSVQAVLEEEHIPHGRPLIQDDSVCVLHHDNFITGYDHNKKISLWTAFTLTDGQETTDPRPECLRPDVRLEQTQQASCADYQAAAPDIVNGYLFSPVWSIDEEEQMDSLTLSNAAPMYTTFASGIWLRLMNKLSEWVLRYSTIHVVTGPIYDYDADGKADENITRAMDEGLVLPSHYYVIMMKCPLGNCTVDMSYDALSFVIPHKPNMTNCATENQYLLDNVARIRDIELLTDLQFLTTVISPVGVRTRTFIPTALWSTS